MTLEHLCMGCLSDKGTNTVCPVCGYAEGTAPESPLFLPPRTILNGRYIIGRVLGDGGFGITYLAWDRLEERKTAVKEYFPEGIVTRSPGFPGVSVYSGSKGEFFRAGLDKFLAEAKALRQFKNQAGIVAVHDFFHTNNTAYIVMEYLEGETLTGYLAKRGGKISFDETVGIMANVFEALSEVHKSRMLHRDIKPDNIFVLRDGRRAVLIDFGAARQFIGQRSKSLSSIVSDGYSPFEQYRDDGEQRAWTDVYALGATLYRMLSGERPPQATSRIVEDKLVSLAARGVNLPPEADAAICKALAVHAKDRHQSVTEFRSALEETYTQGTARYLDAGIPAAPPSVQETGYTRPARNSGPLGKFLLVTGVLVLVLSSVLFIMHAFVGRSNSADNTAVGGNINRGNINQGKDVVKQGNDFADRGSYDAAIAEFDKAIQLDAKHAEAYYERGTAYIHKGLYDQAIADYNKAIELKPKFAMAYHNRGFAYWKKGLRDKAIADYNKAIELDPKYAVVYNNRGTAYVHKGLYDQAIADYNKAIELDPEYANAYVNRGRVYGKKGRQDMALVDYGKAMESDPKYARAYYFRGNVYLGVDAYDQAIADYSKVIELDPKAALAYYNRAAAYKAKGVSDRAGADYQKSTELQSEPGQIDPEEGSDLPANRR